MDVEIRLRENESVSMSRQLESVAHNEEMTEKVRVLEGTTLRFYYIIIIPPVFFQENFKCYRRQAKSTTSAIFSPNSCIRWDRRMPPARPS